ncbi:ShlB/FhaC/HecB family hemolysin secretion/activation protein [Brucella sp. HL-2]|nr:ShlB/FhaC/HecB family hemolysin secretion/activation protein [Brucella sp. HL-2]MCV9910499.1 ShlB/FhaC/HecB family hemolysin secretion/activation protein [Brucella sp. HL-2]
MMHSVRLGQLWLALSAVLLASTTSGFTQQPPNVAPNPDASPADDFMRRQAEQDLEQRLRALGDATPRAVTPGAPAQAGPLAKAANGPCFAISHVEVEGVTLLSSQTLAPALASYQNKCLDLADINVLLKDITSLYMDAGYITSRIYVPDQDIAKTRVLRLVATEGSLSDIYLNGAPAEYPGLLATAFPDLKGKPVNIRDVEQGLDQVNRLSSNNAKTAMLPGKEPGASILNVENKPGLPWHFSVANNNLGQKSTGYSRSSVSFRMDNLANLNDLVSLTYEHTGPDYPWPNDGTGQSNSISGSISVPYGYWSFTLNGSYYKYSSLVQGTFNEMNTSGDSAQIGFNVDRVILRDKDSITTLNAGLAYKETNNFMMGDLIEVGSRHYSVANLGISHSRRMLGGLWVFDVSYNQGLGVFGATKRGTPGAGDAEPEFSRFTGTINVTKPFQLASQNFQFSTLINGQYSPDNLYGAEQVSLGGYSNVRGTRNSILFGNNGAFTRNELVWRTVPWSGNKVLSKRLGELRPYAAIDYGHVVQQTRFGIEGGDVSGWTVGTRLSGGNISADIGYSRIIKSTTETNGKDLFFVSTSLQW